jgi:CRP/FNR family transcriptional regulator
MLTANSDWATQRKHAAPVTASVALDDRLAAASSRKLSPKEHVFCEGDAREHVFRVEDGVIAIYKTLPDGRRQIIDFAYPGDLIGLGVLDEHMLSAQATSAARVRCLSAAALERMAETDAGLALKLYKSVCHELAATRSLLVTVGQRSAIERVAAFLVTLHRRTAINGSMIVQLAMRRSDIADLLRQSARSAAPQRSRQRVVRPTDVH